MLASPLAGPIWLTSINQEQPGVMMGAIDFLLRVVAADIDAYERFFFDKLSRVAGIQEINSMVALSEIKATTELPIPGD